MAKTNEAFKLGDSPFDLIIGDKTFAFDYPIYKLLEVSQMAIVLLEIPPKTKYNKNVFGISLIEKRIKWQININNLQTRLNKSCPFTNILIYENQLLLNNWCSFNLIVHPVTGQILEELESR
jgi:hypothetical protein